MIPIVYKTIKDDKIKQYRKLVTKGFNLTSLNRWCKKYMACTFIQIIEAQPKKLKELQQKYDSLTDKAKEKLEKLTFLRGNWEKEKGIKEAFYTNMPIKAREMFIELTDSKVCPYCNRNYINMEKIQGRDENVRTYQLDHILPKDSYPIFCVSFFNLVPVCASCNQHKSSGVYTYTPYRESSNDLVHFDLEIHRSEYMTDTNSFDIKIMEQDSELKPLLEDIHIEELYQMHKDVVQEIIAKVYKYGIHYIDDLTNNDFGIKGCFETKEEVYRLLFANYYTNEKFSKRPLAKMTKDIFEMAMESYNGKFDTYIDELMKK